MYFIRILYNLYTTYLSLLAVVNCGPLSNIPNGAVDTSGGTNYKCTAVYTCDTGYVLNGMVARTCQVDGMWSGNEPTCDGNLKLKLKCKFIGNLNYLMCALGLLNKVLQTR